MHVKTPNFNDKEDVFFKTEFYNLLGGFTAVEIKKRRYVFF